MTDIFVSVDVETTGPIPGLGELCTIGAVAYHGDTLERVGTDFYVRLQPASSFDRLLVPRGFTRQQALDSWLWGGDTRAWWEQQDAEVIGEALYPDRERHSRLHAAKGLKIWLDDLPGTPVFVAHPVGFDWPWVNYLLLSQFLLPGMAVHEANPFGYRPACLRALSWAQGPALEWSLDRSSMPEFHCESEVPHHALHDAIAQGETLVRVLRAARERYGYNELGVNDGAELDELVRKAVERGGEVYTAQQLRALGTPPPAEELPAEDRKALDEILAEANRQVPDAAPAAAD